MTISRRWYGAGLWLCLVLFTPQEMVRAAGTPDDMVLVPAGEFAMGTSIEEGGFPDEQPMRLVYLGAFWIDRYEVSNAAYARFVQETGYQAPANAAPALTSGNTTSPYPASSNIRSST